MATTAYCPTNTGHRVYGPTGVHVECDGCGCRFEDPDNTGGLALHRRGLATDYARTRAAPFSTTRYRAEITYVTHVEPGTDELVYEQCSHEHSTPEAAERCARLMARRHTTDVR
jgi:hypothetical protein